MNKPIEVTVKSNGDMTNEHKIINNTNCLQVGTYHFVEKKAYTDLKERTDKLVELLEIEKKILTLANCKGSANQIGHLIKEYKKGSVDE